MAAEIFWSKIKSCFPEGFDAAVERKHKEENQKLLAERDKPYLKAISKLVKEMLLIFNHHPSQITPSEMRDFSELVCKVLDNFDRVSSFGMGESKAIENWRAFSRLCLDNATRGVTLSGDSRDDFYKQFLQLNISPHVLIGEYTGEYTLED